MFALLPHPTALVLTPTGVRRNDQVYIKDMNTNKNITMCTVVLFIFDDATRKDQG